VWRRGTFEHPDGHRAADRRRRVIVWFLLAPISFDFTRSYLTRIDQVDLTHLMKILRELEDEGREIVMKAGVSAEEIRVTRSVDMRYLRQGYEIRVSLEEGELIEESTA
jgi:N-methylhydantoinase A